MSKMENLIEILLDPTSSDAEKDDAAIELANFTDTRAEEVLLRVASDSEYDEMIRASCGESLAEIWLQRAKLDFSVVGRMSGAALIEALSLIKSKRPDWYRELIQRS